MRFWDSSALVSLAVEEPLSAACRRLLRADRRLAAWALTRTEMISAIRRKERAAEITPEAVRLALLRVRRLAVRWTEIHSLDLARARAEQLLAVHPLRAADALQLAAALLLADGDPAGIGFVVVDDRLARAAAAEGFQVIIPGDRSDRG
jgi:predicted nucleic acid-binding protein